MAGALISKPGITRLGGNAVPKEWSQSWFRDFISDYMKGADVRNAVALNGLIISGNLTSPYATLSVSNTGTGLSLGPIGVTKVTGPPYAQAWASGISIQVLSTMQDNTQNSPQPAAISVYGLANPNIPGTSGFVSGEIALRMSTNAPSTNGANWGEIGWGSAIYSNFTSGGSGDCSGINIPLGEGSNVGWIMCFDGRLRHRWGSHTGPATTVYHDPGGASAVGIGPWYQFGQCTLGCNTSGGTSMSLMSNAFINGALGYFAMATGASATVYEQNTSNGDHSFKSASTGTVDTALSLTQEVQIGVHAIGDFFLPALATTASAANAFINNASSPVNQLLRSTSSIRYKTNVGSLGPYTSAYDASAPQVVTTTQQPAVPVAPATQTPAQLLVAMRPVTYTSLARDDDPTTVHLGFIAEEMANVDPRLVHFTREQTGTELYASPENIAAHAADPTVPLVANQVRPTYSGRTIPDGVQYERITTLLVAYIQALEQRLAAHGIT